MTIQDKTIVGKKGEILPKKPLREMAGINPGDEVLIEAFKGELIIKKIYSIEEALSMPVIDTGTPTKIEKDIEEERILQEKLTNEEH
ncbi:MAG: AbrB/MazE/SpoVT family DNA-binding domain-containing protein [Promethearchaeota archaeon]|nr:MAG: AbrB/MazE/SpoVT family DNA-binding domain-containing protein [Candidatus Lokiarchaeota archaeon]